MMHKRRQTFKPRLEFLEDRCCPSISYSTPIDLGTLGGPTSYAYGLNNPNANHPVQVVGQADTAGGSAHAFLWQNGAMTDLGTLGGPNSSASAINNAGQVVGEADAADGSAHVFLWQNGTMTDLGFSGSVEINGIPYASINNLGQVVGGTRLWQNGVTTDLTSLLPPGSQATGINDNGLVSLDVLPAGLGSVHAYTFNLANNQLTTVGGLNPWGSGTRAFALNNSAQVVGMSYSNSSGTYHPFLWQNGKSTDLVKGSAYGKSRFNQAAQAINNSAQVVGYVRVGPSSPYEAFLWQNGTLSSLNTLILANTGWVLNYATGINDTQSAIVGYGTINNQTHAFLTTDPPAGTAGMNPAARDTPTDSPSASGGNTTLTASGISAGNPSSTIIQVAFYLGSNSNGSLPGEGTQSSGAWTDTVTVNLSSGSYTLSAQADDSDGDFRDPLALSLSVV